MRNAFRKYIGTIAALFLFAAGLSACGDVVGDSENTAEGTPTLQDKINGAADIAAGIKEAEEAGTVNDVPRIDRPSDPTPAPTDPTQNDPTTTVTLAPNGLTTIDLRPMVEAKKEIVLPANPPSDGGDDLPKVVPVKESRAQANPTPQPSPPGSVYYAGSGDILPWERVK